VVDERHTSGMDKETEMVKLTVRYTRYAFAALSSVAFLLEHPLSTN
jgi:hypothetical protein